MFKKSLVIVVFFMLFVLSSHAKMTKFQLGEIPKNILIISQSSEQSNTIITAIDLDNNELIIITFDWDGEYKCFRTGIICDPNKQQTVKGESAPFKEKK